MEVRTQLGEAAVRLAQAVGYVNAGTCEFLVDADNKFYFIEVNARIQVEHPVTEMVTGIDLVKQQIRIASGEPLPFTQADIRTHGHAIECRINSEDPDHDFRPSPGKITGLRLPGGPGVRWDSHIQVGYSIPPNYDSLVGKLIVHGTDRAEALAKMRRALDELVIEGVQTTIPLHKRIFQHPDFISGRVDTTWVERVLMPAKTPARLLRPWISPIVTVWFFTPFASPLRSVKTAMISPEIGFVSLEPNGFVRRRRDWPQASRLSTRHPIPS